MEELGASDRRVLALEAVQGREQELRFTVVDVPHVAADIGVAEIAQDLVIIDTSAERALAADPQALVSRIADKLAGGSISATLRAQAVAMIQAVPASEASLRVAEALYLISTSPEFALQR